MYKCAVQFFDSENMEKASSLIWVTTYPQQSLISIPCHNHSPSCHPPL